MRPLAFTFPYVFVFAVVVVWSFIKEDRLVRRGAKASLSGKAPADRGSLYVVIATQGIGFLAAFMMPWIGPAWARIPNELLAFWLGIALMAAGAALRRLCFRTLGESFTGEVRIRPEQHVVSHGPYRWVRHPGYSAGILMAAGAGLTQGTWLGTAVAVILTVAGYAYRVAVEERALAEGLGAPYREYMSRTKRFVPFVI